MRGSFVCAAVTALALTSLVAESAFGQGRGRGFGRGNAEPPGPAPTNEEGRVLLGGITSDGRGVWTPRFGIMDPIAPADTLPFQPWARELFDYRQARQLEPHSRCKASGLARQFLTPYGVEIVELQDIEQVFIFDIGGPHTYRVIYMDGRSHPVDPEPTNYGHSIGWWEGDTLVIDTVGFNTDFWMDRRGLPHTEQLHAIERLTRVNEDTTEYEITIDDPGAYTAPWTANFSLGWQEGTELFEYICQQANYAHELMTGEESTVVDRSSQIVP